MHCSELVSYIIIPLKNPITIGVLFLGNKRRYGKSRSNLPRKTKRWNRCMQESRLPRRSILIKRGWKITTSSPKKPSMAENPMAQCRFFLLPPKINKRPKNEWLCLGWNFTPKKKSPTSVAPPEIATRTRLIYGALDVLCWRWPQLFFGTKMSIENPRRKKNTMMFLVCLFKQKYCSNSSGFFLKETYWSTFHRNFIDWFVLDVFPIVRCFCAKTMLRCLNVGDLPPWAEENPWGKDAFENATWHHCCFATTTDAFLVLCPLHSQDDYRWD